MGIKLDKIYTDRSFEKNPWFDIVFEWEDIFSQVLQIPLIPNSNKFFKNSFILKITGKWKIYRLLQVFDQLFERKGKTLYFDMGPRFTFTNVTSVNVIPIIIDFWKYIDIQRFNDVYRNCKVVFITSLEAYNYLLQNNCTLPIRFLPLSLPDQYQLGGNTELSKEIDVISVGRCNPVLLGYMDTFAAKYPEVRYAIQAQENGKTVYKTNFPGFRQDLTSREDFFRLIRKSRVAFYSTPGMDGGEQRTGGFNPVTPRIFELLSAGCRLLGRYPETAETQFFNLPGICRNVRTYQQFEDTLLEYLQDHSIPFKQNQDYLSAHYASVRARELAGLLQAD